MLFHLLTDMGKMGLCVVKTGIESVALELSEATFSLCVFILGIALNPSSTLCGLMYFHMS